MSSYIVDFIDGSNRATFQTENVSYTDRLNLTDEAIVNIAGSSPESRAFVKNGTIVEIKRNNVVEFYGNIIGVSFLDAGGISARCKDFAFQGAKKKALKKTYTSTASATIFTEQINNWNSSYLGTIATGVNTDFQAEDSSSSLNIISNLRKKTDQDIEKIYSTKKINIVNHKGSSTSVLTFNDYIDISDLGYDFQEPIGNVITVYGKGSGENQIISESTEGRNVSSIASFGEIEKTERDLTIVSVDEANTLANVLADKFGPETKSYTFRVNNPNQSVVSGDVITLNSKEKNLIAEEVRIVGIKRGLRQGIEFLEMEVANLEYSELVKSTDKLIGDMRLNNIDQQTYNQDTSNTMTFSGLINATSTAPLRVVGNLPSSFIKDEVGNIRVNSFTVDYDVDPFRSSVGTASEDDVAPSLTPGSTDSHKHDAADSGHPHGNATQTSTANFAGDFEGSDSATGVSCSNGVWTTIVSEFVGTAAGLVASFELGGNSGGAEDIQVRIRNSGVLSTHDAEFGIYLDGFRDSSFLVMRNIGVGPASSDTIYLEVKPESGAITLDGFISLTDQAHTHSISSWNTNSANAAVSDSNKSPGLNGNTALHNHNVAIGDQVSDAGSVNATAVDVYVDWWNGSAWINKHSILAISDLIKEDLDVSNGGTLPDASGFWRARVFTNNANADLIQSILKVKHNLNTQ